MVLLNEKKWQQGHPQGHSYVAQSTNVLFISPWIYYGFSDLVVYVEWWDCICYASLNDQKYDVVYRLYVSYYSINIWYFFNKD